MKVAIYRKEHFNAAHRLYNHNWTEKKNSEVFGPCSYPNWHGHNYELVVRLIGEPDADTGFVYDMKKLSTLIKKLILNRFDHRNLNLDCEEFRDTNPTAENIAIVIYNILRPHIEANLDLNVRLYETERNYVEYPA